MLHVYRKVRAVHHMELCSPPASIRKVLAVRVVSTPAPSSSSHVGRKSTRRIGISRESWSISKLLGLTRTCMESPRLPLRLSLRTPSRLKFSLRIRIETIHPISEIVIEIWTKWIPWRLKIRTSECIAISKALLSGRISGRFQTRLCILRGSIAWYISRIASSRFCLYLHRKFLLTHTQEAYYNLSPCDDAIPYIRKCELLLDSGVT